MERCKTCSWRSDLGFCGSPKITERYGTDLLYRDEEADSLIYSYQEGGSFWVGPEFGCVHWNKRDD